MHLSVLDGLDVVYVDKLDSPQPLLAYSTVGGRAPAYAVATGKALLVCQTADYLDHYGAAIKRHTEDTHVSLLALKQELADVNRIGYAINRGEWRQGIGGIAAPIFNGLDKAVAALGISGPLERLTNQKMREYAPLVQQGAAVDRRTWVIAAAISAAPPEAPGEKMNQESTLAGVRVIEICNVAAGPFCGMLLADMGADVIKIEPPGTGDTLRSWAPITDGWQRELRLPEPQQALGHLNLKNEAERDAAIELIAGADVLIENNRPGVMDRLGLELAMRARNPRLVYCSVSAYGQSGPAQPGRRLRPDAAGHERADERHRRRRRRPVKCGVPVCDFTAGLYAAFAIAAALRRVQADGQGTHIDVSMLRGHAGHRRPADLPVLLGPARTRSSWARRTPQRAVPGIPLQERLLRHGRRQQLAMEGGLQEGRRARRPPRRPALCQSTDRAEHQVALRDILEAIFAEHDSHAWLERFRQAGVPCAPINDYSEVLADPQVEHMDWVQDLELPNGVRTRRSSRRCVLTRARPASCAARPPWASTTMRSCRPWRPGRRVERHVRLLFPWPSRRRPAA